VPDSNNLRKKDLFWLTVCVSWQPGMAEQSSSHHGEQEVDYNSMVSFLKYCQTVSTTVAPFLHSHQQGMKVPISPYLHCLFLFFLLNYSHPSGFLDSDISYNYCWFLIFLKLRLEL
jgi:hypothetical protein